MSRMLKHPAELTNRRERSGETTAIVAPDDLRAALTHQRPGLARRVRHHRPRPRIQPRVTFFIPRFNVREAVIDAALLNVKRSDHHGLHAQPDQPE
jgi:hypothetical protein